MVETTACEVCGTEVAPALLWCPGCHRLVHGDRLKALAEQAEDAEHRCDLQTALATWREALELIPPESRQYEQVEARITALGRRADADASLQPVAPGSTDHDPAGWSGGAAFGGLGAIGLLLFKFKFLIFILVSKAKFLLLGLTKLSTFLGMFASFGLYWAAFGWPLALGLVLSFYAHEMGHLHVLRRYGVNAEWPMFIPGLGALVRYQHALTDVGQDARVSLAGPIWGLGAALACFVVSIALQLPILAAVAKLGALINLLNLIPLGPLDGGRAFRAFSRSQRWLAAAAVGLVWTQTHEGLLVILMLAATFRALIEPGPKESDRGALIQYVVLVAALSTLLLIPVAI